jgi:hypothetical protein
VSKEATHATRSLRGLHVEVDVRQRCPQRGEEALHQQAVPDRVDAGDAEEVVHQAACARATCCGADAELTHQVGDVRDGEEVGREPERVDHGEF